MIYQLWDYSINEMRQW